MLCNSRRKSSEGQLQFLACSIYSGTSQVGVVQPNPTLDFLEDGHEMYHFKYNCDGDNSENEKVDDDFDDPWVERSNPNPIVNAKAVEAMKKLDEWDRQFFVKEIANKRYSKFTSYDACPKGSVLSSKEHKVSVPGQYHNCPFIHTGSGDEYLSSPILLSPSSPSNGLTVPKSSRLPNSQTKKGKTREICSQCSFNHFAHEDAGSHYESYLRQHTFAHLYPEGPPNPAGRSVEALRRAFDLPDRRQSAEEIKRALLGEFISATTPQNWLEELREALDPGKKKDSQPGSKTLVKTPKKSGSTKIKRTFRVSKAPPRPIISAIAARKTRSSQVTARRAAEVALSSLFGIESMTILNKKFSDVKSRYLNMPTKLIKKSSKEGDIAALLPVPLTVPTTLKLQQRPKTAGILRREPTAVPVSVEHKVIPKVMTKSKPPAIVKPEEPKLSKPTKRKKIRKMKLASPENLRASTTTGGIKVSKPKLVLTKKKKASKTKHSSSNQAFGFEFEEILNRHKPVKNKTKAAKKGKKTDEVEAAFAIEKYKKSILKMLERGDKASEDKLQINSLNDTEADCSTSKPRSQRHRKVIGKKRAKATKTEPVTLVLYKGPEQQPHDYSKSATALNANTTVNYGNFYRPTTTDGLQMSGWTKKNTLFLPIGLKPNMPMGPKTDEDSLQSIMSAKGIPQHTSRFMK